MREEQKNALDLIDFIEQSPTGFHAVATTAARLKSKGFIELKATDRWEIQKGGKYFVTYNHSACIAFVVGMGNIEEEGFKIIGAHTDSPTFRIKPKPEIGIENYIKLNVEVYGGPILNTWMDRPLSIAGRVMLRTEDPMIPKMELVNFEKPVVIIPNLAIHMNRKINEGVELNKQKDLLPIMALIEEQMEKENILISQLAQKLHVEIEDILDFDLFLYEHQTGCIMGLHEEFISSPRLDDLAMVHAGITALGEAIPATGINVMVCFDNEEVGSSTKQGADSPILVNLLERIMLSLHRDREDFFRALGRSFLISADMAHAVHPNTPEKHDPTNRPLLNKGPVIKISANQTYTSDSDSTAVYTSICKAAGVPVQKFVNRSDERGGSTIGPISATHLPIRSVDIGNPMLAMHSVRELGGVMDHTYILKSFETFYRL